MSFDCDIDIGSNETYKALKQELTLWAKLDQFPLYATMELTPYCNLKCPMCYVRLDPIAAAKQGRMMSGKQWLEIARQARDMGLFYATLTGGEPLMHPDFWEIYEGMREMGILVSIYTNGCLIDEKVVERFKANPPLNIKMSIYGASDETYETMCGVKNGFTKAARAIDLMKEAGLTFYCTSTIVHENLHDVAAMYLFAHQKGIKFFHTSAVTNSARDALSTPNQSKLQVFEQNWTLEKLEKEMHPNRDMAPFALCPGHTIAFFMTWHGHMQFCSFVNQPYAQIGEEIDMPAAWKKVLEQAAAVTIPEECATCEHYMFCKRCPGLLASESGDPSKAHPAFCQQAADFHRVYDTLMAQKEQEQENPHA